MVARARERFAAERRHLGRRRRQAERQGALPNLVVIGGLKCGTTSLHHYLNLHPRDRDVAAEGAQLLRRRAQLGARAGVVREPLRPPARGRGARPRRTTPTGRGSTGVAERMRDVLGADARLVYMVRDPIDRMLSHYLHNVGGGYETRPLERGARRRRSGLRRSAAATRCSSSPTWRRSAASESRSSPARSSRDERDGDDASACSSSAASTRRSPHRSSSASGRPAAASRTGGFRLMDRAVRLPGLRALDRNFDRLPESPALDGRADRPRPGRRRGAEAGAARRAPEPRARGLRARCRAARGRSGPAVRLARSAVTETLSPPRPPPASRRRHPRHPARHRPAARVPGGARRARRLGGAARLRRPARGPPKLFKHPERPLPLRVLRPDRARAARLGRQHQLRARRLPPLRAAARGASTRG